MDSSLRAVFARRPEDVHTGLRELGLLPAAAAQGLRPADVLLLPPAPHTLVAHIDPQAPHSASGGVLANFPSGLNTEREPPELTVWGTGDNLSYLILYFRGLAAVPHTAGLDMEAWVNNSVTITATNGAGLTVSSGATSNRVVFEIPFTPDASGLGVISLTPGDSNQGFSWYGTDVYVT